jgi:hypothetical protein
MPVRSSYAKTPIPRELRRTPYPLQPLQPERPPQQPVPVKEPTITQIKNTVMKFGDYLERNQRAYHRDFPEDSTWEDDLCRIPGRVCTKSAEFGHEQRGDLRSRCRQSPTLIKDLTCPAPKNIRFEVKKQKPKSQPSTGRRPRRRRTRAPETKVIYVVPRG